METILRVIGIVRGRKMRDDKDFIVGVNTLGPDHDNPDEMLWTSGY